MHCLNDSKELADKKKQVTEQDLLALAADQGRTQNRGR